MPNVIEAFGPFSFAGAEFPHDEYEVIGKLRDHVHEYPHVDGGDPEKLGRALYEIRVKPIIHAGLLPERYQRLFPERLQFLTSLFEQGVTDDLNIPGIGIIKAYCFSWNRKGSARNLSGVDCDWVFREDQSGKFGETFLLLTNNLAARLSDWTIQADALPSTPSIFDKINDAALQVLSIKDQMDLYGGLVAAKIDGLVSLIQEADSQLLELRDPDNFQTLAALQRLLASVVDLGQDIAGKGQGLRLYTVPMEMGVAQVSVALYGNATRAAEIMQLNSLDNPLAIPGGTKVVYYQD